MSRGHTSPRARASGVGLTWGAVRSRGRTAPPTHEGEEESTMRRARLVIAAAALAAVLSLTANAFGGQAVKHAKFKIALSNSYIGNKWRIEMENLFKAACKMPPYSEKVDCSVYNSGNDVSKQSQQISNLISQGVDAIVVNAASPTG